MVYKVLGLFILYAILVWIPIKDMKVLMEGEEVKLGGITKVLISIVVSSLLVAFNYFVLVSY